MEEQKDLPKPLTDLPLPEKELSAHSTPASQDVVLRSYRKFLVLGIGFVILLAIIGGAYFLGRNSILKELNPTAPTVPPPDEPKYDPTADWQTYTNTKYGYSIKVPVDWRIDRDETLEVLPGLYSPCSDEVGDVCTSILLGPGEAQYQAEESNETVIKVAGENAQAYEVFDSNDENSSYHSLIYAISLNHNDTPFSISYEETLKGKDFKNSSDFRNKKLFDQILSTFKFTK